MPGWTFVGVKPSEKGQAREKGRVDRRKGGRNAGKEGAKEEGRRRFYGGMGECVHGKFEVD